MQSREFSANTRKAYTRELKKFLAWTNKPLEEMTARDLDNYKDYLRKTPSTTTGTKLKAATINRILATLKSFYQWLTATDSISKDPTRALETLKTDPFSSQEFTPTEVEALHWALTQRGETEIRDRALLSVLEHGLRGSEVMALNIGDYDGTRLLIRQAKYDSVGTVPLAETARQNLDSYLDWRSYHGFSISPNEPLFISIAKYSKGERLQYSRIYGVVAELGAIAGVENCHPHRFRHTFATNLVMNGMSSQVARTLTRHRSESSFARYTNRALYKEAEKQFFERFS